MDDLQKKELLDMLNKTTISQQKVDTFNILKRTQNFFVNLKAIGEDLGYNSTFEDYDF